MSDQFGGRSLPFASGSVFGVRAWRVGHDGRLHGVVHPQPWEQDVTLAYCAEVSQIHIDRTGRVHYLPQYGRDDNHAVAQKHCGCGFYGFYDNGLRGGLNTGHFTYDSYARERSDAVLGIVEGFGRVSYGHEGFRASKGRVVALVNPHLGAPTHEVPKFPLKIRAMQRFYRIYGVKSIKSVKIIGIILILYMLTIITGYSLAVFTDFFTLDDANYVVWGCAAGLWIGVLGPQWIAKKIGQKLAKSDYNPAIGSEHGHSGDLLPGQWQLLTNNYPDVPQYPTLAEAMRAHRISTMKDLP